MNFRLSLGEVPQLLLTLSEQLVRSGRLQAVARIRVESQKAMEVPWFEFQVPLETD